MLKFLRMSILLSSLFLGALALFLLQLGHTEVTGFDSRFFVFAQSMYNDGLSWFPQTYHQPYPDYPVTSTIFIYFLALLNGHLSKLIAVFPSAIAAALTLVFTYLIGSLIDKRLGKYAVCCLLLCFGFVKSARAISLDMYIACITSACFFLAAFAAKYDRPKLINYAYPLLFLGFALRGPIGLIIPTGVLCSYYLVNQNLKQFFKIGIGATVILGVGIALLLSIAWHAGGVSLVKEVLRMQAFSRLARPSSHLFYVWNGLLNYALAMPFACLVCLGLLNPKQFNKENLKFLYALLAWVLVIVIGMSIPGDKKIRYILAISPALAVLAAYPFVATETHRYFIFVRALYRILFFIFPTLLLLPIIYWHMQYPAQLHLKNSFIFLGVLQFFIFFAARFVRRARDFLLLCVAVLSFFYGIIYVIEPLQNQREHAHAFVTYIENLRQKQHADLIFYNEDPDNWAIKYMANVPVQNTFRPIFLNDQQALLQHNNAFLITSDQHFSALAAAQFAVIARGKVGHVSVVVFQKKE